MLGEDVLQAVRRLIRLEECAERPDEFHQRLRPVFGDWGAKTLEKMIVKDLFQRLNFSMADRTPFDFERYVNQARVRLSNEKKGSTEHG